MLRQREKVSTDVFVRKPRRRAGADVSLVPSRYRNVLHCRSCLSRVLRCSCLAVVGERVIVSMCEHCVGWFLRNKEYGKKLCFLDPDNLVEINDSTPTCEHFELSNSAAAELEE